MNPVLYILKTLVVLPYRFLSHAIYYFTHDYASKFHNPIVDEFYIRSMCIELCRELCVGMSPSMIPLMKLVLPSSIDKLMYQQRQKYSKFEGYGMSYDDCSYWLRRNPSSPTVIVYMHGGAFGLQTFWWVLRYFANLADNCTSSILLVDYKLAGQFPEAVNEVTKLYDKLHQEFENVLIVGDSAGGNLSLNVMQYALENDLPQPNIFAISPWVNVLDNDAIAGRDILNTGMLNKFAKLYTRGVSNPYTNPYINIEHNFQYNVWDKMDRSRCTVIAGSQELLHDQIQSFCKKLEVVPHIEPNGIHVSTFFGEILFTTQTSWRQQPTVQLLLTTVQCLEAKHNHQPS